MTDWLILYLINLAWRFFFIFYNCLLIKESEKFPEGISSVTSLGINGAVLEGKYSGRNPASLERCWGKAPVLRGLHGSKNFPSSLPPEVSAEMWAWRKPSNCWKLRGCFQGEYYLFGIICMKFFNLITFSSPEILFFTFFMFLKWLKCPLG